MCIISVTLLYKQRCYVLSTVQNKFVPYTVLVSSKLPTTLTALCHESLLIAISFVSDLNNLFIESCVQYKASRGTWQHGGWRCHPMLHASMASEQALEIQPGRCSSETLLQPFSA